MARAHQKPHQKPQLYSFPIDELQAFLKKFNFEPNDIMGQNFLADADALAQIVAAADLQPDDEVLEIGSGIGNLTVLLAARAKRVLAVEKDKRYFPILKEQLGDSLRSHTRTPKSSAHVQLEFADIMRFNFQEELSPGYKVVANIPYYITGKIVEMLLTARNKPSKIVLLMQREVAQRITAPTGELSILALAVSLYADARVAGWVPKEAFYPQPKVDSAILVFDVLPAPRFAVDEKKFFKIIKAAFTGKRKQIHNSLQNNLGLEKSAVQKIFDLKILPPDVRPQAVDLATWVKIYEILGNML